MNTQRVRESNYVTCICGRVCKGKAAAANHYRVCPTERARSAEFIRRIEEGI